MLYDYDFICLADFFCNSIFFRGIIHSLKRSRELSCFLKIPSHLYSSRVKLFFSAAAYASSASFLMCFWQMLFLIDWRIGEISPTPHASRKKIFNFLTRRRTNKRLRCVRKFGDNFIGYILFGFTALLIENNQTK